MGCKYFASLQRYQVIPLKLWGMVLRAFTKDNLDKNSKSDESTEYFHSKSIYVFQSMKSVDDGIVRLYSLKALVGTVGDFSMLQSHTYYPPILKKYS